MKQKLISLLERERLLAAFLGALLFILGGYYAPKAYLQFFDKKQYVSVPTLTTFDRKIYSSGETQVARLTLKTDIDANVLVKSQLMLILVDNEFKPIKSTQVKGFVVAKDDPQTYIIDAPLPCNLVEGKYFYRAQIQYYITRIKKITPFDTDFFTIDNNRASDSAQINKNCSI